MEAALIRERVLAGLEVAKQKGTILGRPTLKNEQKYALQLYTETNMTIKEIARESNLSLSTVYKIIKNKNRYTFE